MASSSSSLIMNPLTSPFCKSPVKHCFLVGSTTAANHLRVSHKKQNLHGKRVSLSGSASSVVCKAVSVKPQTEIEGLNIAEDVSQVWLSFFGLFYGSCEVGLETLMLFSMGVDFIDDKSMNPIIGVS